MFFIETLHIPMQVGPPTDHARMLKPWLFGILLLQVGLTIWYELLKFDLTGVLIQAVQIAIGYYAWVQDMNITLICAFGVVCLINGVILTVMALIPILQNAMNLNLQATIAACFLPAGNLAGAVLGRLVYMDWKSKQAKDAALQQQFLEQQAQGGGPAGLFAGLFGGAGAGAQYGTAGVGAPPSSQSLFSGQGFTLGGGDANMAKARAAGQNAYDQGRAGAQGGLEQGRAYGAAGMEQGRAYGSAGMAQAQAKANEAQGMFGGMFGGGKAGGKQDVSYDPFLTREAQR